MFIIASGLFNVELLTNQMPFQGMSNLESAYAAATPFKQVRPSRPEDIPSDIAFIVQSRCVEDPNLRPSFKQIVRLHAQRIKLHIPTTFTGF